AGVRQFLDIGTGLPVPDNTHEIAQGIAPESRVLYVDNDPIVMTHARALTRATPPRRTAFPGAPRGSPPSLPPPPPPSSCPAPGRSPPAPGGAPPAPWSPAGAPRARSWP